MARSFDVVYPPKDRIHLDGGLNNKYDPQIILDNETPSCMNVIFENGSVETRPGTAKLNTTSVGSYVCEGLYTRHDNTGSESMCAWYNGSLFVLPATTFVTVPSAQSIYTAGGRIYSAEYQNYIFFCNSTNIPYKYNNGDFTRHGIYPPQSTPTAATAPTGTGLTGEYVYKVTYVNSGLVEGDVSTATSTFTAANENIRVTIPTAPASYGVIYRRIYRTEAGGTDFKRVTTVTNNTATTYDDAVADVDLGVDAPTDQGVPPNYAAVLYHQARLFVIDPGDYFIKYSEIGNPYVFKALSFIRLGNNCGEIPKTLAVFDNSIMINCQDNNSWLIYMPSADDADWIPVRIKTTYGSNSPFAVFNFKDRVMFAATENSKLIGFAAAAGDAIDPNATLLTVSNAGSNTKSDVIEPDIFDINESYLDQISAIVYKQKAYITVPYGGSQTTNNRIYVYDYSIENISKSQKFTWSPWSGLNANQFAIYGGKLYYGCSDDVGHVYEMLTSTYNDSGAAIDSYYWTKEFSGGGGHDNWHKDFRYINILYELSGTYFMDLFYRLDSDLGVGNSTQIDLNPGSSTWGSMRWGLDTWEPGKQTRESKVFLGNSRGKRIQFKFTNQNTLNQKFKIVGINYAYNLRGKR